MADMTRREALKAAAASAGVFLGGGLASARSGNRNPGGKLSGRAGLVDQLPPPILQLAGLGNVPALPIDIAETLGTVPRLLRRLIEEAPAFNGLSNLYTIGGQTKTGFEFLFGDSDADELREGLLQMERDLTDNPARVINEFYRSLFSDEPAAELPPDPLTLLPLEAPDQWTISWTNFREIFDRSLPHIPRWAATMTDVSVAEEEFWPTQAKYGVALNLLVLKKLTLANFVEIRLKMGAAWTPQLTQGVAEGRIFAIDMSIFQNVPANVVKTVERFTPATITILRQDPETKLLKPVLIRVSGQNDAGVQTYSPATATPSAWLYAMLAARTSVTVFGIWLGHAYQLHLVTAAMLMTMRSELPRQHPVREMLVPQSDFVTGFDDLLLLLWPVMAPPTSVATAQQFLQLVNIYAQRRSFAADDPKQALADLGLQVEDFTTDVNTPWDRYPIVGHYLEIWDAVESYATSLVDAAYARDRDVSGDQHLQSWIEKSGRSSGGNVQGLGAITTKAALVDVLTSLVYRITIHGVARLMNTANPAMTFVANFPPCLQSSQIPAPTAEFDTATLLSYLPRTGTIGQMVIFYFTFAFSSPYVPMLPRRGNHTDLYYDGGVRDPRNQALIRLREAIAAFIAKYQPEGPQYQQWPRNIET